MAEKPQSYEHHAKMVPGYHYVATLLLMVPTLYFAYRAATDFNLDRLMLVLFAVGVLVLGFYVRAFPLGVQDRVIRLEERLRMQELLPEELKPRIAEFTMEQLIGLRFASDEELPELARRVLDEGIADGKSIKRAIRHWRADHARI